MKNTMKKTAVLFAVLIASVLFAVSVSALNPTGQCGDNVYWEFDETTGELIISGEGEMWDYSLNDMGNRPGYTSYSVDYQKILKVTISEGVTSIGDYAFYGLYNFEQISIPNSIITIGEGAFYSCDGLTSIIIPDNVTEIGDGIFTYCDNIANIIVSSGNLHYMSDANGALYNKDKTKLLAYPCKSPATVYEIPNGISVISEDTFFNCKNLKEIIIPDSVEIIEYCAFYGCESLEKFTIPNKVTELKGSTFENCINLKQVNISDSVKSIGSSCFENCLSLQDVVIPNSVVELGESVFYNCVNLTNIALSNNIATIRENTFYGCANLKSVNFPENLKTIEMQAFSLSGIKDVVLPKNVVTIGDGAFFICNYLETIVIPEKVNTIDLSVVATCPSLITFTILNPNIIITNRYPQYEISKTAVLSGCINSDIEKYAYINNFHFLPLDGENAGIVQNHQYPTQWNEVLSATCTERGLTMRICRTCCAIESKEIAPLGHDMRDYVITTPATCEKSGSETSTCSRCDNVETKNIPAKNHSYSITVIEPTCTNQGYTTFDCACGDTYNANYVNNLNHKVDNSDYFCDYNCGYEFEKPAPEAPNEPEEELSFFEKIVEWFRNIFEKLFGWLKF